VKYLFWLVVLTLRESCLNSTLLTTLDEVPIKFMVWKKVNLFETPDPLAREARKMWLGLSKYTTLTLSEQIYARSRRD